MMLVLLFHDIGIPPIIGYGILAFAFGGPVLATIGLVKVFRSVCSRQTVRIALIATAIATIVAGAYFLYFLAPKSYSDHGWAGILYTPTFPFGTGLSITLEGMLGISYFAIPIAAACNFLAFLAISSFFTRRRTPLE